MTEKKKKFTIHQLIEQSKEDKILIIGALANSHILDEYKKEKENIELGVKISPKLTQKEFEEIIEKFKKKEV